jgi:hypothetical protein
LEQKCSWRDVLTKFTGVLTATLRNHVLDQTSDIFLRSYQTARVRENLSGIIFGAEASSQNDHLFEELRGQSTRRVPNVPLHYRSREELLILFRGRRDVTAARTLLVLATDSQERQSARARLNSLLDALNSLLVKEEIKEYIKKSDALALQGDTGHAVEASRPSPSYENINARIGAFLTQYREAAGHGADMEAASRVQYIVLQGALYGRRMPPAPAEVEHIEIQPETRRKPPFGQFICLLCDEPLKNRFSLTRHTMGKHGELLSRQHRCPRCSSDVKAGADKWCAHVEKCHYHETVAPNISTAFVESKRSLRSRPFLMEISA